MTSKELLEKHVQRWASRPRESLGASADDIRAMEKEVAGLAKQSDRYAKAYAEGLFPIGKLEEYLSPVRERIRSLESQIAKARSTQREIGEEAHLQPHQIKEFADNAAQTLQNVNFETKRSIVMNVIDKVVATQQVLEVHGVLPISEHIGLSSKHRDAANTTRHGSAAGLMKSIPFELVLPLPPPQKRGVDYGFLPGTNESKKGGLILTHEPSHRIARGRRLHSLGHSCMLCTMAKRTPLGRGFFERGTLVVARELLGKYLVHSEKALMITEVEAYDGPADLASHAARGRTPRNALMFGDAGIWYIYLCYGIYRLLNIVTGPRDYPAAILIRGVEGVDGPGRLTRHFGIDASFNGKKAEKESKLWIEDRGVVIDPRTILRTPRIGVAYAGPVWAAKKYRFVLRSFEKKTPGAALKKRPGKSAPRE